LSCQWHTNKDLKILEFPLQKVMKTININLYERKTYGIVLQYVCNHRDWKTVMNYFSFWLVQSCYYKFLSHLKPVLCTCSTACIFVVFYCKYCDARADFVWVWKITVRSRHSIEEIFSTNHIARKHFSSNQNASTGTARPCRNFLTVIRNPLYAVVFMTLQCSF
jgi:hypothetical protein